MIKVQFKGGEHNDLRYGVLVSCVHVFSPPVPGPIGQREQEVRPNIWGVVVDDKTGVLVELPIRQITGSVL